MTNALQVVPAFGAPGWLWDRDYIEYILQENSLLKVENSSLRVENSSLKMDLYDLRDKYAELKNERDKLFEQANLGCDTSGIPSSKDWKKGGAAQYETDKSDMGIIDENKGGKETPITVTDAINGNGEKKRRGGQINHTPAFMAFTVEKEGEPVRHFPRKCVDCIHREQCVDAGNLKKFFTGHGYDIEVIRVHREHQEFEATCCPQDGRQIHEDFPEVIGAKFYEINVQLYVLTGHHILHGSYDRIALAAKELLGLSMSAGTANAMIQRVGARILSSGFMDAIRFFILLYEKVLGVDETSANVGGRNAWVYTAVTDNVTLLTAHWSRGYEGVTFSGILQFYIYTLISDCWAAYFNAKILCGHAVCNGHILRELVAAAYFRSQAWAISMFDLLIEILSEKNKAAERGETSLAAEYIENIRSRYRQYIDDGYRDNPGVTKGKTISLLDRLNKYEDAVLAFAVDFNVHFTNNASEISLRNLKVALRVIGQFKTMTGLWDYCVIQSFMDTCRKQGHNPFDMFRVLLSGGDVIETVFGSEKAAEIKQMINLTDAIAAGDDIKKNEIIAGLPFELSDELLGAASYGRIHHCGTCPPPEKPYSFDPQKEKLKSARIIAELKSRSKTSNASSANQPP